MAKEKKARKEQGKQERMVNVVGFVDEVDRDDGTVGVRITTEDAESFPIHLDRKGEELLDLVDEEVFVTGTIQKDSSGNRVLWVKSYEIVDEYEDDEDEDEDYGVDDYDDFRDYDDDDVRPRRKGGGED